MEIIRRFVNSLSYPGSIVLDFFAGSGTTGRICIEEGRHSILVDNDPKSLDFFNKHLNNMKSTGDIKSHEVFINPDLNDLLKKLEEKESIQKN